MSLRESLKRLAIYACYALAYVLLREAEAPWGDGRFSLLRPEAGLCFAFLWLQGAPRALPLALATFAAESIRTSLALGAFEPLPAAAAAVQPLVFGAVIALVRTVEPRLRGGLDMAALPVIIAAIGASLLAALAVLPIEALRLESAPIRLVWAGLATAVGALLGTLLVAPFVVASPAGARIWAIDAPARPRFSALPEFAFCLAAGIGLSIVLFAEGYGVRVVPLLLALSWIAFRYGRGLASLATIIGSVPILWLTARLVPETQVLGPHLGLVSTVIVGQLIGAITDRLRAFSQEERRRAAEPPAPPMSRAAIHEVAQPLSILVMESARLARRPESPPDSLAAINQAAERLRALLERNRELAEAAEGDRPGIASDEDADSLVSGPSAAPPDSSITVRPRFTAQPLDSGPVSLAEGKPGEQRSGSSGPVLRPGAVIKNV